MTTQAQIAAHLDLSQTEVSKLMEKLGIDWKAATLDEVRMAYLNNLRAAAAAHLTGDGFDLTHERVLTERVERELKQLSVAEKKSQLINVTQLEPAVLAMVGAFRTALLAGDNLLKANLDALYGVDVDLAILNGYTHAALSQLTRSEPGAAGEPDCQ